MSGTINVGRIEADLAVDSNHLDRGLASARKAMDAIEREMRQLTQEFHSGTIAANEYGDRMTALGATFTRLQSAMQGAYAAQTQLGNGLGVVNAGMGQATAASGRFAQGLIQVGYIADDIQYGFKGIVNNIQPLVFSFSAAAGASTAAASAISAGAGIAAVATYQLYTNWDHLMDLMGMGKVRTEAEEMEELAKATSKTADEAERLHKWKKKQSEIQSLKDSEDKETRETGKAVKTAIEDAGFNKMKAGLLKVWTGEGTNNKPMPDEELDKMRAQWDQLKDRKDLPVGQLPALKGRIEAREKELQDKAREKDSERADNLLFGAIHDPGKRKELEANINKNPKLFPPGILKDIQDADPAARKQQDLLDKQAEVNRKQGEKERKRKEDIAEAQKQGRERDARIREQKEEKIADAFMRGKAGEKAIQGLNVGDVKGHLVEAGVDDKEADESAPRILNRINANVKEKVLQYALEHGMTADEAKGEMVADAREKERRTDEATRGRDVRRANEVIPGLNKQVESRLTIGEAMGGDPEKLGEAIGRQVEKALLAKGVDAAEAKRTADAVVEEGQQSVDKKISDKAQDLDVDAAGAAKRRASEVFDGSELSRKVQSAVGGADDIPKKQLSMLEKSEQHLAIIAAQKQGNHINMKVKR